MVAQFLLFSCLVVLVTTQIQEEPPAQERATYKEKQVGRLVDTMDITQNISKEIQRINDSLEIYTVVEKDLFGESAEGGVLTASYNRLKNLKKITTIFYGETGKAVTEYYLDNEKVFFVDVREYTYDKPMYLDGSQIKSVRNSTYYFHDNRMIMWKNYGNNVMSPISEEFIQEEKLLLKDIDNILAELGDHK